MIRVSLRPTGLVFLIGTFALGAAWQTCTAQETAADLPLEFPSLWVGSEGVKVEDLKGKAAILYFYEETCPKCKGYWPGMMKLAEKYADKPVAFIAVNSGTPVPLVSQYARSVQLNWPMIADIDRSFEKRVGIDEISLQNTRQVAYLDSQGQLHGGNWAKIEETIERALKGAKWNVEPADVPEELRPVWRSIEFAQYARVAQQLAKARGSRNAEVKAAGKVLSDVVDKHGARELAAAKSIAEKSKQLAYEQYEGIADRFAGYSAGAEAAQARRELAKDPALRKELAALKQVEKQRPLAQSQQPAIRARARAALEKIVAEQPASEAARLARELLEAR